MSNYENFINLYTGDKTDNRVRLFHRLTKLYLAHVVDNEPLNNKCNNDSFCSAFKRQVGNFLHPEIIEFVRDCKKFHMYLNEKLRNDRTNKYVTQINDMDQNTLNIYKKLLLNETNGNLSVNHTKFSNFVNTLGSAIEVNGLNTVYDTNLNDKYNSDYEVRTTKKRFSFDEKKFMYRNITNNLLEQESDMYDVPSEDSPYAGSFVGMIEYKNGRRFWKIDSTEVLLGEKDDKKQLYSLSHVNGKPCYSFSLKTNNNNDCEKFMNCIISGGGGEKNRNDYRMCKDILTKPIFDVNVNKVKQTNPELIHQVLKKLYFKVDNNNVVEPIDHWMNKLPERFRNDDVFCENDDNRTTRNQQRENLVKTIIGNSSLVRLLAMYVDYMNDNLDYFKNGKSKQYHRGPAVDPYTGLRKHKMRNFGQVYNMMTVDRIKNRNKTLLLRLSGLHPIFMGYKFGQLGGNVPVDNRPALSTQYQLHNSVYNIFSKAFSAFEKKLMNQGKEIGEKSKRHITDSLNKLMSLEKKVIEMINTIELYSRHVDRTKDYQNETVNLSKMKKLANKFNTLLKKKESVELLLSDVWGTLEKILEKHSDGPSGSGFTKDI